MKATDSCDHHAPTSTPAVQARLREATGDFSFRQIGELAGCHPESARRWLTSGTRPPLWFIVAVCESRQLNPNWVMTGVGAVYRSEARAIELATATPRALLDRLAVILESRLAPTGGAAAGPKKAKAPKGRARPGRAPEAAEGQVRPLRLGSKGREDLRAAV